MDPLIGRVIAGRYEILQRIGSGGMGSVYRARQASVARQVALKVLRPDLINNDHIRQRFNREAEIIGRLSHPNTIRLYEFVTTEDGLAVMVMELLEGRPLSERLKSGGPLGVAGGMQVGIEVARALSEAHLLGLVHRDLKPANIFLHDVGGQQITKVLDFGIARLMDEEATRLTVTDQVFGTPRYMSPEQGLSTANVDARSDLYSLGLILYECVVGQPPFVAQTSYQYLSAHSTEPPPKLREAVPTAPEALEQLIDACLEKHADDRPQTAQVVAEHLEAIRRSLEAGVPPPPPLSRPRTRTAATQPADQGTVADTRSIPGIGVAPSSSSRGLMLVLGVLVAVLVGLSIVMTLQPTGPKVAVVDAGVSAAPEAGIVALLPAVDEPDSGAGTIESAPDAGTKPDASRRRRRRRRRPRKKSRDHVLVGPGAVTGPRGMVIEIDETKDDLPKLAATCKQSIYAGLSAITTKGCPSDCAILVDGACAGRTPAERRAIPPGQRDVAVICKGKVRRTASIKFEEKDVTVFRCR